MRRTFPRVSAGLALAATLLPLCVFAAPVHLQVTRCDSAVPKLNAKALKERTTYGLKQAIAADKGKASLVSAAESADAEVLVSGKLARNGKKLRLVYSLETTQEPKQQSQLTYDLPSPKLTNEGVTNMARDILAEAAKLEEERQLQATPPPAPEVASAPPPAPEPVPSAPVAQAPSAPVAAAPAPAVTPEPHEERPQPREELMQTREEPPAMEPRMQPLVVVHTGLTGLWGSGTRAFGIGAVVEPKWNITDFIAAGLRIDGGVMVGGRIAPQGTTSVSMGASVATLAKGEFLLGRSGVRPFAGVGAGMYILASQSVAASSDGAGIQQTGGKYFGVAPQLGIDFGGVRLAATYNRILGGEVVLSQGVSVGGVQAERVARDYVQLELSFRAFKSSATPRQAGPRGY